MARAPLIEEKEHSELSKLIATSPKSGALLTNWASLDTGREPERANLPRQARLDSPGTLHHVMVRGIEKAADCRFNSKRMNCGQRRAPKRGPSAELDLLRSKLNQIQRSNDTVVLYGSSRQRGGGLQSAGSNNRVHYAKAMGQRILL